MKKEIVGIDVFTSEMESAKPKQKDWKDLDKYKVMKGHYLYDDLYVRPGSLFKISVSVCGHKKCTCIETGKHIPKYFVSVICEGKKAHSVKKTCYFETFGDRAGSFLEMVTWHHDFGTLKFYEGNLI